jgi:hypothetical protein
MGQFQAFPACRYHYSGKATTVQNPEEDKALGGGWAKSPTEFAPYQGPRRLGPQHDPVKWVDQWLVEGMSEDHRKKVKAKLHRAHAAFWRSPDAPNADTDAMRLAFDFDGVAHVLFDAGFLNEPRLAKDIPQLVWDSAIAGGWWRLASETRLDMFPEKLGHYWVYRDNSRDWNLLFTAEAAEWQAKLLGAAALLSDPAEPTKVPAAASSLPRPPEWEFIKIVFISDERVQIWIGDEHETRNYSEMGFADRRNRKPSRCWSVLRIVAQNQGFIPSEARTRIKGWPALEKQIERTRKLLKSYFGLDENPIIFEKGGYRLRCKIECAPSFHT